MTPSAHNPEGQKCVCHLGGFSGWPCCGEEFIPSESHSHICGNVIADGTPCVHGRACHTPSAPAEPMVKLSISQLAAIRLAAEVMGKTLGAARTAALLRSILPEFSASTQSPEGK